ncbi:hypothetical protein [Pseudaminobacter soli (ex Li et al. 2025)]|nr:hypothetical protein [Mesorhizobium soli]
MNLKKPKKVPASSSDGRRQLQSTDAGVLRRNWQALAADQYSAGAETLIKLTLSSAEAIVPHLQKNDR